MGPNSSFDSLKYRLLWLVTKIVIALALPAKLMFKTWRSTFVSCLVAIILAIGINWVTVGDVVSLFLLVLSSIYFLGAVITYAVITYFGTQYVP
jgi:hypothetical protein